MRGRSVGRLKVVSGLEDVYASIVECLDTPKTVNRICADLGIAKGGMQAMMDRLIKYGAITRSAKRMHTSEQSGYFYTRLMPTVKGEQVLIFCGTQTGKNGVTALKPTIEGARVIDFNSGDLSRKLLETQRMTRDERKSRSVTPRGSSFTMFDMY